MPPYGVQDPDLTQGTMHDHNCTLTGQGPLTLLLVHGYGCDQDMWRSVIPTLAKHYRVMAFDQAGCGRRGLVPYDRQRHADLTGYAEDLVAVVRHQGVGPVVVVGHSVSAMIGVLAAQRAPDLIQGLAMIGPSPCYLQEGDYPGGFSREDIAGLLEALDANHRTWAATMAPVIMGNLERPSLATELEESFCRMDPVAASGFARATFLADNRRDLASVRVPTLILQCRDDAIANAQVGQYIHDHIPGSTLVHLQATGHCPHLSAPDEVLTVLLAWLRTQHA